MYLRHLYIISHSGKSGGKDAGDQDRALAADTYDIFSARFPDFEGQVHVSRIYRDARRLFGRGPYKDHLWFSVKSSRIAHEGPDFWFLLDKDAYGFGLGFWSASPVQMEAFRRAVDANPARFRRIAEGVTRKGYALGGEPYKRPKKDFGDEVLNTWYNRKWLMAEKSFDLGGAAFTPELPRIVANVFAELMPLYEYLLEVYLSCPEEMDKVR